MFCCPLKKNYLHSLYVITLIFLYSCLFFENEIGGEGERIVSLSREVIRPNISGNHMKASNLHRSASASSIGLLEPLPGTSFWCQTLCPYVKKSPILEKVDQGSSFYLTYFRSQGVYFELSFQILL